MIKGHSGLVPSSPYADARVLSTKVSPELHKALRQFAVEKDATVSAVVKAACEHYISRKAGR
jgi:predicted transcriptional regulator